MPNLSVILITFKNKALKCSLSRCCCWQDVFKWRSTEIVTLWSLSIYCRKRHWSLRHLACQCDLSTRSQIKHFCYWCHQTMSAPTGELILKDFVKIFVSSSYFNSFLFISLDGYIVSLLSVVAVASTILYVFCVNCFALFLPKSVKICICVTSYLCVNY